MTDVLRFYLNGQPLEIADPDPEQLLLDYLRSPAVGLIGPKKGCGQGGCGACAVVLSAWDDTTGEVEHRSINSCLRPICALQGLSVTTVEGTGAVVPPTEAEVTHPVQATRAKVTLHNQPAEKARAALKALAESHPPKAEGPKLLRKRRAVPSTAATVHPLQAKPPEGMNPVAHRLAVNNGSQCGYCSAGFVMTMSGLLAARPKPTKREIEAAFDGNLCRCTGYRPILTAMKTFAADWSDADEANRMKCAVDPGYDTVAVAPLTIPFPEGARRPQPPLSAGERRDRPRWRAVDSVEALQSLVADNPTARIRLVHGNTAYGIYPDAFHHATLLADIRAIPELSAVEVSDDSVRFGAGVSYGQLIDVLEGITGGPDSQETTRLGALDFMARRTAGGLVRNAASVGGNSMLTLAHIHPHTGDPFPSDAFTALAAIGAQITTVDLTSGARQTRDVAALCQAVLDDGALPGRLLLVDYAVPRGGEDEVVLAQKTALREVNAHTIVNTTTRLTFADGATVQDAVLVYGGIAPYPFRATQTEALLTGRPLSLDDFPRLAASLTAEVTAQQKTWARRMAEVPNEGFTDAYRQQLAVGFLYKAIVNALLQRDPSAVPPAVASSGQITWGRWPVSDGTQSYSVQGYKAPVSVPYIGLMTLYQTSGEVHYTHEAPVPPSTLQGALIQSTCALGTFEWSLPKRGEADREAVLRHLQQRFDGVVDLLTVAEIPRGGQNLQGMGADQPIFADGEVRYLGQCLGMVLCTDELIAQRVAAYAAERCVTYGPIGWPAPFDQPILGIEQALRAKSIYPDSPASAPFVSHIWRIVRPGSLLDWVADVEPTDRAIAVDTVTVDGVECVRTRSSGATGGQVHFYMETQACVARPDDGNVIRVNPSSQSPQEMHQTSATAIGVPQNRIRVQIRQLGGAYGGKTEQARFVTGPAVIAADVTNRTVRLVMKREADTNQIGKRHPYYGQCQVALDTGAARAGNKGLIRGLDLKLWGDGGAYYDCSFVVSNNIVVRADNAYNVPHTRLQIDVCRTNTAPNTAMRSFGDIQSKTISESAIDDAAFALGMSAEAVRRKNMYRRGDTTPFGQALTFCYMREVWDHLAEVADFEGKRAEVGRFNAENRWRKRGLAMVPVKYGSGYNLAMLEQASAIVSIYQADGTVVINQGGVDMGQGALTQVLQVGAYILGIPMSMLRVELPDTVMVLNPSSTGASTGTAYNGEAVKQACTRLRDRLMGFGYDQRAQYGDDWCRTQGIDFWNHREGWSKAVDVQGRKAMIWQFLVAMAYTCRVNLSEQFLAPMRGADIPAPALEFKPEAEQPTIPGVTNGTFIPPTTDNFVGFTYSAALSVVEVDVLTGESKIISTDLMYDMGWSINPALDIGQVEGAFVQGVGFLFEEWMIFEPEGPKQGQLNTLNTWRYKIPAITSIPLRFDTHLFPRGSVDVPDNPNELLSAKEVGEPPVVLAVSAFLAAKQAVRASRLERGLSGLFRFDAPASVQAIREACAVDFAAEGAPDAGR